MPNESRVLSFSRHEVYEALRDYRRKTGQTLVGFGAKDLTLVENEEIKVTLQRSGGDAAVPFTEHEVGAALILFCRHKHIPIARRAAKTLAAAADSLELRLSMKP